VPLGLHLPHAATRKAKRTWHRFVTIFIGLWQNRREQIGRRLRFHEKIPAARIGIELGWRQGGLLQSFLSKEITPAGLKA
jgi:hypothetical protein